MTMEEVGKPCVFTRLGADGEGFRRARETSHRMRRGWEAGRMQARGNGWVTLPLWR